MLALWNLSETGQKVQVDLTKWISENAEIRDCYPCEKTDIVLENKILMCHLEVGEAVYMGIDL